MPPAQEHEACEDSATAIDEAATENTTDSDDENDGNDHESLSQSQTGRTTQHSTIQRSKYGGGGFIAVLIIGLLYSIVNAGVKLSASDPPVVVPSPAPSTSFEQFSAAPSPSLLNSSSLEWQCEKEVTDSCGHTVDEEEDDENAGKGPDE